MELRHVKHVRIGSLTRSLLLLQQRRSDAQVSLTLRLYADSESNLPSQSCVQLMLFLHWSVARVQDHARVRLFHLIEGIDTGLAARRELEDRWLLKPWRGCAAAA